MRCCFFWMTFYILVWARSLFFKNRLCNKSMLKATYDVNTLNGLLQHVLRRLQWNHGADHIKSLEWGDLAADQHPRVSITNQLIFLTDVSCLWHDAHGRNLVDQHTAENSCCNECVCVRMFQKYATGGYKAIWLTSVQLKFCIHVSGHVIKYNIYRKEQ